LPTCSGTRIRVRFLALSGGGPARRRRTGAQNEPKGARRSLDRHIAEVACTAALLWRLLANNGSATIPDWPVS
jgi:hypothetical protein